MSRKKYPPGVPDYFTGQKRRNRAKFPPLRRIVPNGRPHRLRQPLATEFGRPTGEWFWGKDVLGHEDVKAAAIYPLVVPP